MTDYSNSVIYKIYCKDKNIPHVYIGSTTEFEQRQQKHVYFCNNPKYKKYNIKLYKFIRANYGIDNWKFEIVEHYPCANKIELHKREYDIYNTYKNTLI